MKTCTTCGNTLPLSSFSKHQSRKDGFRSECKQCVSNKLKSYKGKLKAIYNNQQSNSRSRNHTPPNYSFESFCGWMENNGYPALYKVWEQGNFKRALAPSTDRLDDSLPYTLNNIRLVTWKENDDKAHQDFISGKLIGNHTTIVQKTLTGEIIAKYPSQKAAYRATKISQGNIGEVCRGTRETAGGFKWEYAI